MEINQSVVRYDSIQVGRVNEETRAVIVDGTCADGNSITQVIGWDQKDGLLTALLSDAQVAATSEGHSCSAVPGISTRTG